MAPFFGICTAFAYTKGEQVIYGRNNDLPPYLRNGSKSEIYAPLNGNKFNLTTSSFINGEEGFNEHGLAVAMTFVKTSLNKIQAGFNSCFVVRYLLEKADTKFMCQYEDPNFETVWSSVFDLKTLMIYRAEGDPRKKKFVVDNRLHSIVKGH